MAQSMLLAELGILLVIYIQHKGDLISKANYSKEMRHIFLFLASNDPHLNHKKEKKRKKGLFAHAQWVCSKNLSHLREDEHRSKISPSCSITQQHNITHYRTCSVMSNFKFQLQIVARNAELHWNYALDLRHHAFFQTCIVMNKMLCFIAVLVLGKYPLLYILICSCKCHASQS